MAGIAVARKYPDVLHDKCTTPGYHYSEIDGSRPLRSNYISGPFRSSLSGCCLPCSPLHGIVALFVAVQNLLQLSLLSNEDAVSIAL